MLETGIDSLKLGTVCVAWWEGKLREELDMPYMERQALALNHPSALSGRMIQVVQ